MIIFFCASVASAADQIRTQKDPVKDQKKLKDGPCQMMDSGSILLTADQLRTRDQIKSKSKDRLKLKDGSCQS